MMESPPPFIVLIQKSECVAINPLSQEIETRTREPNDLRHRPNEWMRWGAESEREEAYGLYLARETQ